jgi:predicted ATPase
MLEVQFGQLDVLEQDILKCASVAGERFSVWAIAAMLEVDPVKIEDACEGLADRRQFIRPLGIHEFNDGEFSAHYEFRHALYRNVLYRGLSDVSKARSHLLLAKRLEPLYSATTPEIASEIAMHFEGGFDYENTIRFMIFAAENAVRRFAYRDSIQILRRALEFVERIQVNKRPELRLRVLELIGDTYYLIGAMSIRRNIPDTSGSCCQCRRRGSTSACSRPSRYAARLSRPGSRPCSYRAAVQLSVGLNDPLLLSQ